MLHSRSTYGFRSYRFSRNKSVTISTLQVIPSEGAFEDGDKTKLDGIEANADVTDTANVTAAGALMDSEVTDLSGIKSVTISTLQVKPSEGAFADGDKTKLDGIEANADVTRSTTKCRGSRGSYEYRRNYRWSKNIFRNNYMEH